MSNTILGCIADDFTGATDLAGLLARAGVPVSLRIGVPDTAPRDTSAFEVIALKSRTAPVEDAVADALAALAWLQQAGATRFFWKYCSTFDSTEQGNIGPVAEALMDALNASQTIYCPAFPENGRAIFMGNLFVGEQPLHESPMKDHPLTPMRDSNLIRLLTPQVTRPVGNANRLCVAKGAAALREHMNNLEADGVAHVVVDAVEDDDLYIIAEACADMPLLTGGSAVAMPLPDVYRQRGLLGAEQTAVDAPAIEQPAIILSGSCSTMTQRQVAHHESIGAPCYRLDPQALQADGLDAVLQWLSEQDLTLNPLIYATANTDEVRAAQDALGSARAGELVEAALAECALAARDNGARRIVVAGGETSGAVTQALGVSRLDIGIEIAPGVPWTYCESNGETIALALKSGNFGSEDFFLHALNTFSASPES